MTLAIGETVVGQLPEVETQPLGSSLGSKRFPGSNPPKVSSKQTLDSCERGTSL